MAPPPVVRSSFFSFGAPTFVEVARRGVAVGFPSLGGIFGGGPLAEVAVGLTPSRPGSTAFSPFSVDAADVSLTESSTPEAPAGVDDILCSVLVQDRPAATTQHRAALAAQNGDKLLSPSFVFWAVPSATWTA